MKYTFALIVTVLCINLAGLMLGEFGIDYDVITYNASDLQDDYNYSAVVEGSDLSEQEFYHVGKWGYKAYQMSRQIVYGVFDDLVILGVPTSTADIFYVLWLFMVGNFFFCLFSGRDYMP